jgi:hypothetical protein
MEQLLAANRSRLPKALVEAEIRDMQVELLRRSGNRGRAPAAAARVLRVRSARRVALGSS